MCLDCLYQLKLLGQCLVHSCLLRNLCDSSIKDLHIGEDQFKIDGLDITCRINRSIYVNNIGILEATYHMHDCINLTDICKELVSESLTLAGTLDKSCNIYEFDGCRCYLLCMIKFTELYDSVIRNRYDSHIRVDRCEWIVGR